MSYAVIFSKSTTSSFKNPHSVSAVTAHGVLSANITHVIIIPCHDLQRQEWVVCIRPFSLFLRQRLCTLASLECAMKTRPAPSSNAAPASASFMLGFILMAIKKVAGASQFIKYTTEIQTQGSKLVIFKWQHISESPPEPF